MSKKRGYGLFLSRLEQSDSEKLVKGSAWMTAGSITSRLLGALYVIPWLYMIGNDKTQDLANALMSVGYRIYNVFLIIATAGIPGVLSKEVAYFNERGEYRKSWQLFVKSLLLMLAFGVISGAIMFATAPIVARNSPQVNVSDAVMVIRSLVPAVVIIPPMSLIRGFIQGHQEMAPSALSMFFEQVGRIVYLLVATFIIMKVMMGKYPLAVAHSTFAAFVGAVISLLYLTYVLYREKDDLKLRLSEDNEKVNSLGGFSFYKDLIINAIPFVLFASATEMLGLVDQFTFVPTMKRYTAFSSVEIVQLYGVMSFNVNKLVMIIISFASSIGVSALPLVASSYAKRNREKLGLLIENNLVLFSIVMLPAAIGVFVVAEPFYNLFYSANATGTTILRVFSIASIFLGLFLILGYILQATNQMRTIVMGLVIAFALKIAWQPVMIKFFNVNGAVLSTAIAFLAIDILFLWSIAQISDIRWTRVFRKLAIVAVNTLIMGIVAYGVVSLLGKVLVLERKVYAIIALVIVASIGAFLYLGLTLITNQGTLLLGAKADRLRQKLHLPLLNHSFFADDEISDLKESGQRRDEYSQEETRIEDDQQTDEMPKRETRSSGRRRKR
ncbi:MAG: putative polysaccharide biosynthesis protein [Bavariicoccus seileri]|uniref:Polysaccharide biosynthesis protein n=1 Tax=Bavariicoccus seileri TaxID=549685 RepID=A0A3D4S6R0_9ENTE|nr:polysaccharide biosynthesis protein [Bavariicoccus seileri]HCS93641.1 polysaccharide biosynthesis protein [Bavariicoccus seileri]